MIKPVQGPSRGPVASWAMWDWGAAAFNTVVVTFVFPPYLTQQVGAGLPEGVSASALLGWSIGAAGVLIALIAPVTGVWADTPPRRRLVLRGLTAAVVGISLAMSAVRPETSYLWLGLTLLSVGSVVCELATVPYNGMLHQMSTPATVGRISGFGSAAGYSGGVVALMAAYVLFISGNGAHRGLLGLPAADGVNVRAVPIMAAVWFTVFATPLLLRKPTADLDAPPPRSPRLLDSYRELWRDLVEQWHLDRNVVYYLGASALFRDGLAATFVLSSVVAANVFGLSAGDILLFGIAANILAALGAGLGGLVDDRLGSKPVVLGSLTAIVAMGAAMMCLSGAAAFWACGLVLAFFVGPSQAAARTMMLRLAPHGREAMMFGLYTMTGRAVSFLAPWMFSTFVMLMGGVRAGIAGLISVIALGAVALTFVKVQDPERASSSI